MNSEFQILIAKVLNFLSYRPRSQAEITRYLAGRHVSSELTAQVLDYLHTHHLIDDVAFTQWLVESRSRSRPRGNRLLRQELRRQGINDDLINQTLPEQNESALAQAALEKKLSLWPKLPPRELRQKAARFLASRGFPWSVINTVIRQLGI